jgi:sec-independent protein translocase protein TatB
MSFSDTVFIFVLALVIFGPKKLPEMARYAGRLLAELRRASNEFRSQIDAEISNLDVEKARTAERAKATPPVGTVASMSLNPASSVLAPHNESGSLAGPVAEAAPLAPALVAENPPVPAAAAETVAEPIAPSSQESHV